ncbi:MAG: HAD family hydrolase [Bacteroidales bacterium]|nr:HAD family hydrolase [Bacteroidales bacterium]
MNLQHLKIDRTWTLFLDRDGVINCRIVDDYVKTWDQFEFLPGVLDSLRRFHQLFGRVIVVTNQQGIGKGLMSEKDVEAVHQRMMEEIGIAGGRVDAVFCSPHLRSEKSFMRKPNIGMALKARRQFSDILLNRSFMAGDSLSDMIFGRRAGMKTILISADPAIAKKHPRQIDYLFPDLISFANAI